jgi:hypothetical protein
MSYWSTLKSIFRTPKVRGTQLTISIVFPDGSGAFDYPVSLPPSVENMLLNGRQPQRVEIWKLYVPQQNIGLASTDRLRLCQVLSFPQNQNRAPDGLRESKQSASGWRL